MLIATRLRAGGSGIRIPVGARESSVLQNVQTDSGVHPTSYLVDTGFFHAGKAAWA